MEQRRSIALVHERDADPAEFMKLARRAGLILAQMRDRQPCPGQLTGGVEHTRSSDGIVHVGNRDVDAIAQSLGRGAIGRDHDDLLWQVANAACVLEETAIDEQHDGRIFRRESLEQVRCRTPLARRASIASRRGLEFIWCARVTVVHECRVRHALHERTECAGNASHGGQSRIATVG